MYKTSVYTLVNGNIEEFTHRKQKSQNVILSASHWLCVNVLLANCRETSQDNYTVKCFIFSFYHR